MDVSSGIDGTEFVTTVIMKAFAYAGKILQL
jgi:hypothetical protein